MFLAVAIFSAAGDYLNRKPLSAKQLSNKLDTYAATEYASSQKTLLKVSELVIYPVKSCAGVSLKSANITETGFEHDRDWMVASFDGTCWTKVTAREYPRMVLIQPTVHLINGQTVLILNAPDMPEIRVPRSYENVAVMISIYDVLTASVEQSAAVSEWLCKFLDTQGLSLFVKHPSIPRPLSRKHTPTLFDHSPQVCFVVLILDIFYRRLSVSCTLY